jgi:SAM-dependent methyltransferase
MPEVPREIVKGFLRKAFYPDYGFSIDNSILRAYHVKNAKPAHWSADSQKPYGTLMIGNSFPHFLLARSVIHACNIRSWCDLGTGSATLPFQVARLGITEVFAIEGSDAALRAGKVQLPLSNYCVADICRPLEIKAGDGAPARFDVVSALELVEHIPDSRLKGFFENIKRLQPIYVIFAIGLQPEPPYHVNLKSMSEWLGFISSMLPGWSYDDVMSKKIFKLARCHERFRNHYPTNHLQLNRNLVIFVRQGLWPS